MNENFRRIKSVLCGRAVHARWYNVSYSVQIMKEKHVRCSQCQAEFPLAWILHATNGAKEVGFKSFCSQTCEKEYFKQGVPQHYGFNRNRTV